MSFRLVEERGEKTAPLFTPWLERFGESTGQGDSFVVVAGAVRDWDEEEPTLVVESVQRLPR